jgi:peptidyl-tRNA hydrolase
MRSVLAHVKNVACIRVGVGRPPSRADVAEYVLRQDFDMDPGIVEKIKDAIPVLLKEETS